MTSGKRPLYARPAPLPAELNALITWVVSAGAFRKQASWGKFLGWVEGPAYSAVVTLHLIYCAWGGGACSFFWHYTS